MNRRLLLIGVASIATGLLSGAAMAAPKGGGSSAGGQLRMALATGTALRRSGRRGVLSVESTLDIADGALLERAKLSQPRLNAAFAEVVQLEAARILPNTPPDLEALTAALQRATDRVLGRPGAKVLLGTVMLT